MGSRVRRGRRACLFTAAIARDGVWTLMAEESVPAAKFLAAYALTLDVRVFRRVMATSIVSPRKNERTQVANVSAIWTLSRRNGLMKSISFLDN